MILEFDYPLDLEPQRDTITFFWDIDILMDYFNSDNPCQFSYQKTYEKYFPKKARHRKTHQKHPSRKDRTQWRQMPILW